MYEKSGDPSEDLLRIAQAVNADLYLSGIGGRSYLDHNLFQEAGVTLEFQSFRHPVYPQRFSGFVPNLAAIDALFNVGNVFCAPLEIRHDLEHAAAGAQLEVA
jgi:hypothetical protein